MQPTRRVEDHSRSNETDEDNGSKASCHFSHSYPLPSHGPMRSGKKDQFHRHES